MTDKVATIPFWKHEYEMWKQRRNYKRILIAVTAVLTAASAACAIRKR